MIIEGGRRDNEEFMKERKKKKTDKEYGKRFVCEREWWWIRCG